MESVILIVPQGFGIERLRRLIAPNDKAEEQSPTTFLIQRGVTHAWLKLENEVISDYEKDELHQVLTSIPNPEFYVLTFSDLQYAKDMLERCGGEEHFLIDNDHGDILTGPDFSQRLRENPNWDWRE